VNDRNDPETWIVERSAEGSVWDFYSEHKTPSGALKTAKTHASKHGCVMRVVRQALVEVFDGRAT
jgi:hypothetical protein